MHKPSSDSSVAKVAVLEETGYFETSIHPEFHFPKSFGSALKVCPLVKLNNFALWLS